MPRNPTNGATHCSTNRKAERDTPRVSQDDRSIICQAYSARVSHDQAYNAVTRVSPLKEANSRDIGEEAKRERSSRKDGQVQAVRKCFRDRRTEKRRRKKEQKLVMARDGKSDIPEMKLEEPEFKATFLEDITTNATGHTHCSTIEMCGECDDLNVSQPLQTLHHKPHKSHLATPSLRRPVDELTITPMRNPSPQIDTIASSTSPVHIKSTVRLLLGLQWRAAHLQSQICDFETALERSYAELQAITPLVSVPGRATLTMRTEALEALVALTSESCTNLLLLEHALRDIVDEDGRETLEAYLRVAEGETRTSMKTLDEKMCALMIRISPVAVEGSSVEIGGGEFEVDVKQIGKEESD